VTRKIPGALCNRCAHMERREVVETVERFDIAHPKRTVKVKVSRGVLPICRARNDRVCLFGFSIEALRAMKDRRGWVRRGRPKGSTSVLAYCRAFVPSPDAYPMVVVPMTRRGEMRLEAFA